MSIGKDGWQEYVRSTQARDLRTLLSPRSVKSRPVPANKLTGQHSPRTSLRGAQTSNNMVLTPRSQRDLSGKAPLPPVGASPRALRHTTARPSTVATTAAVSSAPLASPRLPSPRNTVRPPIQSAYTEEDAYVLRQTEQAMNARFSDMHRAFQWVDLDRSGFLSRTEMIRALKFWGVPYHARAIDTIFNACDKNKDGEISYAEFVDALARDTVQRNVSSWEREQYDGLKLAGPSSRVRRGPAPSKPPAAAIKPPPYIGNSDKRKATVALVEQALNSRFQSMHKAFQFMDLDMSGRISVDEVKRALHLWNVPTDSVSIDAIFAACDKDSDGNISYTELVNALARDKVQQATASWECGETKFENIQAPAPVYHKPLHQQAGIVQQAENAVNTHFSDMHKAFQYMDVDHSGTLDASEVKRALDLWNVPASEASINKLLQTCDINNDGQISYKEFVDLLARDKYVGAR